MLTISQLSKMSRLFGCLLALGLSGCGANQRSPSLPTLQTPTPITAYGSASPMLIFASGAEAPKILNLVRASGFASYVGGISNLVNTRSLLVSANAKLSVGQTDEIQSWVSGGGSLVTLNDKLDSDFGLAISKPLPLVSTAVPYVSTPVLMATPLRLGFFAQSNGYKPVVKGKLSSGNVAPLMVAKSIGKGKVLATSFDPFAGKLLGYEIIPSLGRIIGNYASPAVGPASVSNIAYLDPGTLPATLKTNVQLIAQDLVGYRAVEIAAWDSAFANPVDDYPYQALINALHQRGILAYAWLEPPFVNLLMWQQDPSCREISAAGTYAIDDWRQLIALEDPHCFSLAEDQWRTVLTQYNWDGVNVAELYFGAPTTKADFAPFSQAALTQFGLNPHTNMSAFLKFRENLVASLDSKVLQFVRSLPNGSTIGLQLTVIDDTLDKTEALNLGSNLRLLSVVAKASGATLQIEDPYTTWTDPPDRYFQVAAHASDLMPSADFSIDINDVNRGSAGRPTAKATMGELNLEAFAAGSINGRVAFYELGTLSSYDLAHMIYSVGGNAIDYPNGINSRFTVALRVAPSYGRLFVDGKLWPVGPGIAIIPSGEHNLSWKKATPISPGILWLDASLGTAEILNSKTIGFSYFSKSTAYVKLSQAPTTVTINNATYPFQVTIDPNGGYWIRLPLGTNNVVVDF